jgi:hypothetical protein
MPFSASTCLTFAGSTPLGPVLSAYTDFDSYLNPFSFVNTNQITGVACPYVFTGIPDGATNIRLIDPTNSCCITIPIQSDDFCNTCDLDFTTYPLDTNSQIIAGDLTGSCQGNISDYVINWFGPNSATNIAFKSGKGSTFSYQFTHPLTGSGFVFAQAGTYTPVIDRVIISGITFSNTGGTGTYDATLDCFNDVQVNPLTCDNGNTPTSAYTHSYSFSGTGSSSIPLNVTFQLSANTNYFGYSFTGANVPDILKITYNGVNASPNQLILENIQIGNNIANPTPTNLSFNQNPRISSTSSFQRVLCLTGITRTPGNESLTIQITPNPGNTEWSLALRCFSSFDCTTCPSQYRNSPMLIVKSSITASVGACNTNIGYRFSGCPTSGNVLTNVGKYYDNLFYFNIGSTTSPTINSNPPLIQPSTLNATLTSSSCTGNFSLLPTTNPACRTNSPPGTITFNRYYTGSPQTAVMDIISTNADHINFYYTSYLNAINATSNWRLSACTGQPYPGVGSSNLGPFSGGTWTGGTTSTQNNTDIRYYRTLVLQIPSATGNTACGGNTSEQLGTGFVGNYTGGLFQQYQFHTGSIVTTGITGVSSYYLRIQTQPVVNGINFSQCQVNCNSRISSIADIINGYSTGTTTGIYNNLTISFQNSQAAMVTNPFIQSANIVENCSPVTASSINVISRFGDYFEYTIPYTTSNTPVLNYSGAVCNWPRYNSLPINLINSNTVSGLNHHLCEIRFIAPPSDFEIWCTTINNYLPNGNIPNQGSGNQASTIYTLAYRFSGGAQTSCNSTFVIGC